VTRPDGTSWKYQYNGNLNTLPGSHVMKDVTYPQGGVISYTYDFVYFDGQANPLSRTTVVKGKRSNNGGNWSFRYAPGSRNTYDTTTVTTPTAVAATAVGAAVAVMAVVVTGIANGGVMASAAIPPAARAIGRGHRHAQDGADQRQ